MHKLKRDRRTDLIYGYLGDRLLKIGDHRKEDRRGPVLTNEIERTRQKKKGLPRSDPGRLCPTRHSDQIWSDGRWSIEERLNWGGWLIRHFIERALSPSNDFGLLGLSRCKGHSFSTQKQPSTMSKITWLHYKFLFFLNTAIPRLDS